MEIFICNRNHAEEPGINKTNGRLFCRTCANLRKRKKYNLERLAKIEQELIWDREFFEKEEYEFIDREGANEYRASLLLDQKQELFERYIEEIEDICIELETSIS